MAGILANSVSVSMSSGDEAADQNVDGFITEEQITLSAITTGSSYVWSIAKPAGSAARCKLTDTTSATPKFTPDVGGYYVIVCTIDGTTAYVLRVSVTASAAGTVSEAIRLQPKSDASVAAPSSGMVLYYSSTQGGLATKDSTGTVRVVTQTP